MKPEKNLLRVSTSTPLTLAGKRSARAHSPSLLAGEKKRSSSLAGWRMRRTLGEAISTLRMPSSACPCPAGEGIGSGMGLGSAAALSGSGRSGDGTADPGPTPAAPPRAGLSIPATRCCSCSGGICSICCSCDLTSNTLIGPDALRKNIWNRLIGYSIPSSGSGTSTVVPLGDLMATSVLSAKHGKLWMSSVVMYNLEPASGSSNMLCILSLSVLMCSSNLSSSWCKLSTSLFSVNTSERPSTLLAPPIPFHWIWFFDFFSMRPMPSITFVMS
mmetsp:Transcript_9884/g.32375  ORF Transcript_9884/g.32375 Transcript_9884/m.32375 type:complete len:273 (+) Transcript_9884:883-1701(+)